ncbi:MAG: VWA domain-containing protein [Planctomycetaceae bacterium]|nr:VWA domain-containing protein [Planctomycetaceae bacterium]
MTHPQKSSAAALPPGPKPLGIGLRSAEQAKKSLPAWLLSLLLHLSLIAGLIFFLTQIPNGAGEVDNRTGGIVLVDIQSESTEYLSEGDIAQNSNPAAAPDSSTSSVDLEKRPELPGMEVTTGEVVGTEDLLANKLPSADSLIVGSVANGKIGGKMTTEVFGIPGTGSRFVYLIDRSKSMEGYNFRPMLAARQELWKSVTSLDESNQFQIIFYNNEVDIFRHKLSLHAASEVNKDAAKQYIESIRPDGGTDHLAALKTAFKLSPDVIFFLTDAEGGFTADEIFELSRRNYSRAIINTIEFGERRSNDRSLEAIARNSGGKYIFKNINTLRVE